MTAKLSVAKTRMASHSTVLLTAVDKAHRGTSTGLSVVSEDVRSLRTAVDAGHQDTSAELALACEGIYSRMSALESLVISQHEQTRRHLISKRVSGASGGPALFQRANALAVAYPCTICPKDDPIAAQRAVTAASRPYICTAAPGGVPRHRRNAFSGGSSGS